MRIIMRNANSDFHVYLIAQAMTDAGADVFSIAHNGMHKLEGALIPCSKFVVYAKFVPGRVTEDSIDKRIEKQFEEVGL